MGDAPSAQAVSSEPGEPEESEEEKKPPFLERFAFKFLTRRAAKLPPVVADDEIHYLNPRELADLRRISRNMVLRAGLIGGSSALITGVAELIALLVFGFDPADTSMMGLVKFWGLVGGVTAVATAFEIGFLYFDALRSVHELARAAGLSAFGGSTAQEEKATASALARAALELPNPPKGLYEINPLREVSKWRLLLIGLVYKLKIGLTNFILKSILRRLLGRAVLRVWLVFVAVPVTAAWNATVAWWVIREARIRVMGPSAAREMVRIAFESRPELSQLARNTALRAVAGSIVRSHDLHPNLVALFEEVRARVGDQEIEELDDTRTLLDRLRKLEPDEQTLVLRVLAIAAILDGRITRDERRLLRDARTTCGRDRQIAPIRALRRNFVWGKPVDPELLAAVGA